MILDFSDPRYLKYLKIMSDEFLILNYKKGWLYHDKYKIKPPKIISISEKIKSLQCERLKKFTEYHNIYNTIIDCEDPEKYKIQYDACVNAINKIDKDIDQLKKFKETIPFNKKKELNLTNSQIQKEKVFALMKNKNDIKTYLSLKNKLLEIEDEIKTIKLQPDIDYYIEQYPIIENDNDVDPSLNKNKKKIYKNISNVQAEKIKINVKNLINNSFKFKNLDECLSMKKKTPYWMSKDEIIKQIDKSQTIKNQMPSDYKKLKKENLCKIIDNLKK